MKDAKGHGSDPRGKAMASAQAAADRSGKPMSVLNLNTVGRAMHVVRDYEPGHETGMYAHQFVAKVDPQDNAAASALSQGTPPSKAGPAPAHPGASGRSDTGKPGFYEKRRNLMNANEAFGRGAIGDRTDDAIAAVERLKAAARRK